MTDTSPNAEFWKRKLMAFLHDSPDKCFDIARHEDAARRVQQAAGFSDVDDRQATESAVKFADIFASAAERFVFPQRHCSAAFTDADYAFIHPLSSQHLPMEPLRQCQDRATEVLHDAVGAVDSAAPWRKKHFLYWRRWLENAQASDKLPQAVLALLPFLPADTRIPDHSIWNHMAVTSAFAGACGGGDCPPALLLFQLGPVQDFIAAARSTRDLWSGSYLLSWLMAHAMKAISDDLGPDAVFIPNLRGNGIFDALHRESMYDDVWANGEHRADTTWERMILDKKGDFESWLLTPTLPNRFLAVVPASQASALAAKAESAVHAELRAIGDAVWRWIERQAPDRAGAWRPRWDAQLAAFPQIAWAVQPWLDREACLAEAAALPSDPTSDTTLRARLDALLALGEKAIPQAHRDDRYYADAAKTRLKTPALLWAAHYALLDAKLAARRNTRDFAAWTNPTPASAVKDSLSGKEECIGDEAFWSTINRPQSKLFKAASHRYGAMNLIKRLWCAPKEVPYLSTKLGITPDNVEKALRFDSLEEVAKGNTEAGNKYVAVLALDGDEMGKWVSGAKTPPFLDQLSPKARSYLRSQIPNLKSQIPGLHSLPRLLTPSYHLQFSEALANFATHKAGRIVDDHRGQLIYAGGDDVLAVLPADKAIPCAEALRTAFRTDFEAGRLYPGRRCDVSCGIAVGHCDAPLQMLVRQAQAAEKRAKNGYSRSALAIDLYKRSGEIIEWGCKWEGHALSLFRKIRELSRLEALSGRFPYALAALLAPYKLRKDTTIPGEQLQSIIATEFRYVLQRQGNGLSCDQRNDLNKAVDAYLHETFASGRREDFLNLFLAETFIHRSRGDR